MALQGAVSAISAESIRAEAEKLINSPAVEIPIDLDELFTKASLSDAGNAECFDALYGKDRKYDATAGIWRIWDGISWKEDNSGKIYTDILATIKQRQAISAMLSPADVEGLKQQQRHEKYFLRCENSQNIKNIEQAAKWRQNLVTTTNQYDADPYLAATQNGTLNLRTGEFYESRREDYITKQLGAGYDPEAQCPLWLGFLDGIFVGDKELIRWIQKFAGYSLTGLTREQIMLILFGKGRNGKSTLIAILQALDGDYAGTSTSKTFDADTKNDQSNDLAMLKGKRFVSMSETAADKKLNEALVKRMTGGDKIPCRFLYKEFFEYLPQFKLLLATNHRPVISQNDDAIWARIRLIPFTQSYEGREDFALEGKLMTELSGILNWALEGLKLWQSEGLKPLPETIRRETAKFKEDSDTVGQWLDLRTSADAQGMVKSSAAYNDFKEWSTENGFHALGNRSFKASLEAKGYLCSRKMDAIYWSGFELKSRY